MSWQLRLPVSPGGEREPRRAISGLIREKNNKERGRGEELRRRRGATGRRGWAGIRISDACRGKGNNRRLRVGLKPERGETPVPVHVAALPNSTGGSLTDHLLLFRKVPDTKHRRSSSQASDQLGMCHSHRSGSSVGTQTTARRTAEGGGGCIRRLQRDGRCADKAESESFFFVVFLSDSRIIDGAIIPRFPPDVIFTSTVLPGGRQNKQKFVNNRLKVSQSSESRKETLRL